MKNLTERSGYFQKFSRKFRSGIFRFGVEFYVLERNFRKIQLQMPVLVDHIPVVFIKFNYSTCTDFDFLSDNKIFRRFLDGESPDSRFDIFLEGFLLIEFTSLKKSSVLKRTTAFRVLSVTL